MKSVFYLLEVQISHELLQLQNTEVFICKEDLCML